MSLSNFRLRKISKPMGLTNNVINLEENKRPYVQIYENLKHFMKSRSNSKKTAEKHETNV